MNLLAVEFSRGIEDAFSNVVTFVPKLIGFLLVLVIGYFVAKAISRILDKVLERVGFDQAVERGGVKRALEKSKYDASDLLGKIVFYALMLFVLQLAFGVFGPNPISDIIRGVIAYLPRVFAAILIIVVVSAIAAAVKEIVQTALGALPYGKALANAASIAILTVGLFAALNQLRIAPAIVNGLFYALLAIVVGSAIVAIGGGGIQPMRQQWEAAMSRVQQEAPQMRQVAQGSSDRLKQRGQELRQQASQASSQQPSQPGSTRVR